LNSEPSLAMLSRCFTTWTSPPALTLPFTEQDLLILMKSKLMNYFIDYTLVLYLKSHCHT
jgi:hypothetical protein